MTKKHWRLGYKFLTTVNPKEDLAIKLLEDISNDGYYINRAIELLRIAESNVDSRFHAVDQVIKLLVLRQALNVGEIKIERKRNTSKNNEKIKVA